MPKYINADDDTERLIVKHALIKEERNADYDYTDTYNGMLLGIKSAQNIITDMPSADVVEVVRCKDCKKFKNGICYDENGLVVAGDDDFCSYGKRRESE